MKKKRLIQNIIISVLLLIILRGNFYGLFILLFINYNKKIKDADKHLIDLTTTSSTTSVTTKTEITVETTTTTTAAPVTKNTTTTITAAPIYEDQYLPNN